MNVVAYPKATRKPPAPVSRGLGEVGNHLRRIVYARLASELLPAFVRTRTMRLLGASVANTACIWSGCNFRSMSFTLGENVFINIGFFFDGAAHLRIERDVRIGQFVRVITATHRVGPSEQRCEIEAQTAPVVVEAGCWIGANVTIMPGVTIRRGCVIGASSTVFASTEPDGLYVGCPARRVKNLDDKVMQPTLQMAMT